MKGYINKIKIIFIICLLIFISFQSIFFTVADENKRDYFFVNQKDELYLLARINTSNVNKSFLFQRFEIEGIKPDRWVDCILPSSDLSILSKRNYNYSILINNVQRYNNQVKNDYPTLREMNSFLENMSQNYSHISKLYSIGKTYEKRNILCFEITDNPGVYENEPGILLMGLHHGKEWPSLTISLYIIEELLQSYHSNVSIKNIIDNRRIWIIPCVNPDGYYFSHDHSVQHEWRKNRRYFPNFKSYGVDINRNYQGSCDRNSLGSWGSIGIASVSHNPFYEIYCGPRPHSELETSAIKQLVIQNNISAAISWHTYGELVLWPWAYSNAQKTYHNQYLSDIGETIASKISTQHQQQTYEPKKASELYPTTGDFADWAYGYSYYILGKPLFPYTIEACTEFHPSAHVLKQVCQENYEGCLYLLQESINISQLSYRLRPPIITPINPENKEFNLSWNEPKVDVDYYQLEDFSGFSTIKDNAENTDDLWEITNFFKTDKKSYGGKYSYTASNSSKMTASMTTKDPLPVQSGMNLSFEIFYDIEENKDIAFIEISTDRRVYEVLDSFTGQSNEWISQKYDLSEYSGTSVFFRFRYTTDGIVNKEGIYIDNISPLSCFSNKTKISESILTTHYKIQKSADGIYYYRVKGYNTNTGWSDYSLLQKIPVGKNTNTHPHTPQINGVTKGEVEVSYPYDFTIADPDGDNIFINISWGDGNHTGWIGPFYSNQTTTINHSWNNRGQYIVQAQAKDVYGHTSNWTQLQIQMPKFKQMNYLNLYDWLIKFLDAFQTYSK